jgi:HD-GYP domain-containing protein (c-di-GMP phosphodiesterase class II)
VGIESSILTKPGELNVEERLQMQLHSNVGGDCIRNIERRLGSSNFLRMAREIAMCHHERWDGTGYPDGLAGEEIPLAARIVAVADVYDALATKRVYKPASPHEKCVAIIREGAGRQFDPDIVEVFLKIESQFREIVRQFPDPQDIAGISGDVSRQRKPKHRLTTEQEQVLLSSLSPGESAPPCEPAVTVFS